MKHPIVSAIITASVFSLHTLTTFASGTGKGGKIIYTTDPATGVKYHYFKHDKKGVKPKMGDFAHVVLTLKNDRDSVFFSSHEKNKGGDSLGGFWIPLNKTFNGCLEQAMTLMATGDSACFEMLSDSIFTKTFHAKLPPFIKSGSTLTFNLKLLKFENQQQFMQEQKEQMEKQQAQSMAVESSAIAKYLKDNNLNTTPDSNGLYIIEHTKTSGAMPKEGDSVEVTYKGTLLNGTVFDASANHGGKGTFSFVYSLNAAYQGMDNHCG
jgi:FKBP-type peptidyl-prolyl cis-trans isomerase FkpA